MQKTVLLVSILMMAGMASAASSDVPKASHTPGDAFYFLDRFSESLELAVAKAPVIGSSELEAKVRANHAAERLAEAQKLAENNKTEKVDGLMAEYSKQTNLSVQSAKKANNTNLSEKLVNVSNNHVKALQDVQKKVPEQAQKGIQNAIENSQKNRRDLGLPEKAQKKGFNGRTHKPENTPSQNAKPEIPDAGEAINKTANKTREKTNISMPDKIQNRTDLEQNTSEKVKDAVDETTETEETKNPTDEIEETVEDTESKITGEAAKKPSTSNLP